MCFIKVICAEKNLCKQLTLQLMAKKSHSILEVKTEFPFFEKSFSQQNHYIKNLFSLLFFFTFFQQQFIKLYD